MKFIEDVGVHSHCLPGAIAKLKDHFVYSLPNSMYVLTSKL